MKKISFFLPGLYGGGAERVVLNLAQGMGDRGIQVDLVLAQLEGQLIDQIPENITFTILSKHPHGYFRSIRSIPALARYLRVKQPDVMISAMYGNVIAQLAKFLAGSNVKLVITEHNTFSIHNRLFSPPVAGLNQFLVRWLYPLADEIVAVSTGVADDLSSTIHLPRQRIRVIVNPVITPSLQQKRIQEPDHPWYSDGCAPVVLAAGRLTEQKDFATLITAFSRLDHTSNCRLMILGEGELHGELSDLVEQLGIQDRVCLRGFVQNPYAYMARSSFFVLSSKWEGLPTVLIEAIACELPVISTRCPSGPEEILKDGLYGRLVPVGDIQRMAEAIQDGIDGKIPRAPKESWEPFTLENAVNQYLQLIDSNA